MKTGLRDRLVEINNDAYWKRKIAKEALNKEEQKYIDENPTIVSDFNKDCLRALEVAATGKYKGMIIIYVDCDVTKSIIFDNYPVNSRVINTRYTNPEALIHNFVIYLRDVEKMNVKFSEDATYYTISL